MSDSKEKQLLEEIARKFKESGTFKDFHGKVTFNLSFGECKNYKVEQSFLPEKLNG
jgi:hypothetical protein